jgi:hypothetical protein
MFGNEIRPSHEWDRRWIGLNQLNEIVTVPTNDQPLQVPNIQSETAAWLLFGCRAGLVLHSHPRALQIRKHHEIAAKTERLGRVHDFCTRFAANLEHRGVRLCSGAAVRKRRRHCPAAVRAHSRAKWLVSWSRPGLQICDQASPG